MLYNKYLPYVKDLDDESNKMFAEIKANLGRSVMLRELRPGCEFWSSQLTRYILLYGFKFAKEDHVNLVKLMYECLIIPDLELFLVSHFAAILSKLLKKKSLLTPKDLNLEWRPLYDLAKRTTHSKNEQGIFSRRNEPGVINFEATLNILFRNARFFFSDSATKEILETFKPIMQPLSSSSFFEDYQRFELFLPVELPPEKAHMGYKLWLEDIMEIWSVCNNGPHWDRDIMKIIADLAMHNVGYIDWEPYFPEMFARFLTSFNLPVSYKKKPVYKFHNIPSSKMALWIVSTLGGGSTCQKHLDTFFKAIVSYIHPANIGHWSLKLEELIVKLPKYFVERLRRERYGKSSWMATVPESHKLTEEDIDHFVESLKPLAMQAVFGLSLMGASVSLPCLAMLRPKLICPELVKRLFISLDSLTEPHKLTAIMDNVIGIARPITQGTVVGYEEGPLCFMPILIAALPGIDPNDNPKSQITFKLIKTFVKMVPLVDASKAYETWTDLTEEEQQLCAMTAEFEDFVLQFFDRVFVLIESSSLEDTRPDGEDLGGDVSNVLFQAKDLTEVCCTVLTQSSSEIFQSSLKKLLAFVADRTREKNVAGHLVGAVCTSFALVNSDVTFKALLPRLCSTILSLPAEDFQTENNINDDLLYNLMLLSAIVRGPKEGLVPYIPELTAVLDRCLFITVKEGYETAAELLGNLLDSLTNISVKEYKSLNYDFVKNDSQHLIVRDWGKSIDVNHLNINWYVPGDGEASHAQSLVTRYLLPELELIEKHINGELTMSRSRLLIALNIVRGTLDARTMLPFWDEPPLRLVNSCVEVHRGSVILGTKSWLEIPDGKNIRYVVAHAMSSMLKHLLKTTPDDTNSFFAIIEIITVLLSNKRGTVNDFTLASLLCETQEKCFLTNQLVNGKQRLRSQLLHQVMEQHHLRCSDYGGHFTETHRMLMLDLLSLSCSHYSQVRMQAQGMLTLALRCFPFAATELIPHLLKNLRLNPEEDHEIFKGTLYVLLAQGGGGSLMSALFTGDLLESIQLPDELMRGLELRGQFMSLLTRCDWSDRSELWPALVKCLPSEKQSILDLLEKMKLRFKCMFTTMNVAQSVPDRCVDTATTLWHAAPFPSKAQPTTEDIAAGQITLYKQNEADLKFYSKLIDNLTAAAEDTSLHWKRQSIAIRILGDLAAAHPNARYPVQTVQLLLDKLICGSVDHRNMALELLVLVLNQQKQKPNKATVALETIIKAPLPEKVTPGYRPDNIWLQYDSKKIPLTAEAWNSQPFFDNPHCGYLQCSRGVQLYAPSSEQPPLDRPDNELKDEERVIAEFFSSPSQVQKLFDYLTAEDKETARLVQLRPKLIQYLFRNFGDRFLPVFKPHLERLVSSDNENSQRFAAEIIAGIIRGSKNWPFDKASALWGIMKPLIQSALKHMTADTTNYWALCFRNASHKRDPNRSHWLLETLMEVSFENEPSFLQCGRLAALQMALMEQEWRVSELFERLLVIVTPHLDHPFQNVRRRIGNLLGTIFRYDLSMLGGTGFKPHIADFMSLIVERLEILRTLSLQDSTVSHDLQTPASSGMNNEIKGSIESEISTAKEDSEVAKAIRLFKTVVIWISSTVMKSLACPLSSFYSLYPFLCRFENYEQDEEVGTICSLALAYLSTVTTRSDQLPSVFTAINKVAEDGSWWARLANVEFLKVFLFLNMSILRAEPQWAAEAVRIVLKALSDSRGEVRKKATEVLAGLIHCSFIDDAPKLLAEFMSRVNKKSQRVVKKPAEVCAIHSNVLGLCAFINASPYDLPGYVPKIFAVLGYHINDLQPISNTIRKTLGDFKRTHYDSWEDHKLQFTDEQLEVLNLLVLPPSYCA